MAKKLQAILSAQTFTMYHGLTFYNIREPVLSICKLMGKTQAQKLVLISCSYFFFRDYLAIRVNLEYQGMQVHLDFKLVMITLKELRIRTLPVIEGLSLL
jgi:hypothetical protein